ncbi:hypothetical protein DAPPUDRAFT_120141 [Daphnia pulex]|uniref:Uncharacterized protein n=1 Tax=Daphnia pulex TaxID=6669 RepID=E9I0F1_DAPPU|nr:hypothetical protein DAPPUDRAFT_120141 [Daphnia pulex]|eukprot:EFX62530.1 hypothetical protein DAPPUDRAFT_120141 [Daphnia pulex]
MKMIRNCLPAAVYTAVYTSAVHDFSPFSWCRHRPNWRPGNGGHKGTASSCSPGRCSIMAPDVHFRFELRRRPSSLIAEISLSFRQGERGSIFLADYLQRFGANQRRPSPKLLSSFLWVSGSGRSQSPGGTGSNTTSLQSHPVSARRIFVFHGGTVLNVSSELDNTAIDLATLCSNLEAVFRQHFPSLCHDRLAVRLTSCPTLCSDAITALNSLSCSSSAWWIQSNHHRRRRILLTRRRRTRRQAIHCSTSGDGSSSHRLLATAGLLLIAALSPEYADTVTHTIVVANLA